MMSSVEALLTIKNGSFDQSRAPHICSDTEYVATVQDYPLDPLTDKKVMQRVTCEKCWLCDGSSVPENAVAKLRRIDNDF